MKNVYKSSALYRKYLTFTFTVDAFPDYTRWDKTKKVLASLQVIDTGSKTVDFIRYGTAHNYKSAGTRPLNNDEESTEYGQIATSNGTEYNVKDGYETFQERFIEG